MSLTLPALLLVVKPKGVSSFGVIRQLRRKTGIQKFGHAGTLDPLASGLMLIGVEKGTKALAALVKLDKEYVADVLLGERRTTGDMEGPIIEEKAYAGELSHEQIESILQTLVGELTLPVSAYSAIRVDGVPMYRRARRAEKKGELAAAVPERRMRVYEAELLSAAALLQHDKPRLHLRIRFMVSSGTYVRSLVEELGRLLGYPAVLSDLVRTKVGPYSLTQAQSLTDF